MSGSGHRRAAAFRLDGGAEAVKLGDHATILSQSFPEAAVLPTAAVLRTAWSFREGSASYLIGHVALKHEGAWLLGRALDEGPRHRVEGAWKPVARQAVQALAQDTAL